MELLVSKTCSEIRQMLKINTINRNATQMIVREGSEKAKRDYYKSNCLDVQYVLAILKAE